MPIRILLISLNRCRVPDAVFPIGLAHLNAALRQAGHETRWFDCNIEGEGLKETLDRYHPDFVGISLRNIDDVVIRTRETFFDSLPPMAAEVRRHARCPVIVGGSGFSIFPERLFEMSTADFGICGNGETSLLALIDALKKGSDYTGIPGLVYRQNGRVKRNASTAQVPAPELIEADRPARVTEFYLRTGGMLNLQTQRGCSFKCCYCTYPLIEGRSHLRRSPDVVAAELEQLQRAGGRHAVVVDSVFNSTPGHAAGICEAILRRGVKISWSCFLRPQGLTAPLMQLMSRAGLTHIEFGSDSLCDEVLAEYQKGISFDDIQQSSELAARQNIDYCHFLICGGPGETTATLEQSFKNSRRLPKAVFIAVAGMRIYPATQVYRRAIAEGIIAADTDLLTPVYYLSPHLTVDAIFERLREFSHRSPGWIPGDPGRVYVSLIERLRKRGAIGPLWSYFSIVQRLWPGGTSGPSSWTASAAPRLDRKADLHPRSHSETIKDIKGV